METLTEPVVFETLADKWLPDGGLLTPVLKEKIIIARGKDGKILINGAPAKVMYNGIQLRFTVPNGTVFIVFDNRHNPSLPIAEMFKALYPEKEN